MVGDEGAILSLGPCAMGGTLNFVGTGSQMGVC